MNRRAAVSAFLALAVLAGCVPGVGSPAPAALRYEAAGPEQLLYSLGDTAQFTVESGPLGPMRVTTSHTGTAELRFQNTPEGIGVTVRFPTLTSRFETAVQGAEEADEDDINGAFEVRLGPRGAVSVVDTPWLSPTLSRIAGPEALVRPFFIRLPDRPVVPGDRWVDTVTTSERSDGTATVATSRITTRLVGDTTISGVSLLVLRTRTENEIETTGTSGRVEIVQRVTGATTGRALWDPARSRLVLREEEGRLSGTLRMVGVDREPLDVSARVQRRVELRD